MIDILLVALLIGVLIAMGFFLYHKDREHNKQINQLIKAVISKTPQDYRDLTLSENTKIEMKPDQGPLGVLNDDFVSLGAADEFAFDKMIKQQLENNDSIEEDDTNESTT